MLQTLVKQLWNLTTSFWRVAELHLTVTVVLWIYNLPSETIRISKIICLLVKVNNE